MTWNQLEVEKSLGQHFLGIEMNNGVSLGKIRNSGDLFGEEKGLETNMG